MEDVTYITGPMVGTDAPDFTAEAYFKGAVDKKVSLSDYKGKWVWLFFYPLDFTFVCPTEIIEASKRASEFRDMNAEVVFVSIDSVYSHQAWCKEIGDLEFPMVADMTKDISMDYNVLNDGGIAVRGAFLIDPDGVLQSMIVNNLPVGRNIDELLRITKAFQTGELCPVNWQEGGETLGKA